MADNSDEEDQIDPPRGNRAADLGRAATKGALGALPVVGSLLAEAADQFLPDPTNADRARWEGEITDGFNTLHVRLGQLGRLLGTHEVKLGRGASIAARYLIKHCPDGLARQYVTLKSIEVAHPEVPLALIEEGLEELESYGLAEPLPVLGGADTYRLTEDAYEVLDRPIMGWNTQQDARAIARWASEQATHVDVSELCSAMEWPARRLNPALRVALRQVEEDHISKEIQPHFVTGYFYLSGADRARLRRVSSDE